jgi:hypothetical protein
MDRYNETRRVRSQGNKANGERTMFDSQCDLAVLVYEQNEDPDEILRAFSADLTALGYRAAGLVQRGRHRLDEGLPALLLDSGEELELFRTVGAGPACPRLDAARLSDAATQIERAIVRGADVLIVNRFGRQELEGKGLCRLVERAAGADIPVVIAVPAHRFAGWIRFSGGMSVKLRCNRDALDDWWHKVALSMPGQPARERQTVCGLVK